jgi:hypothetical protein
MSKSSAAALSTSVLGLLGLAAPAHATLYCEIRPTRDGFVALRAAPSPDSRMLQRMKPGDEILLGQGKRGPWVEVTYWRGGRFSEGGPPEGKQPTGTGWMNSALIARDSCG